MIQGSTHLKHNLLSCRPSSNCALCQKHWTYSHILLPVTLISFSDITYSKLLPGWCIVCFSTNWWIIISKEGTLSLNYKRIVRFIPFFCASCYQEQALLLLIAADADVSYLPVDCYKLIFCFFAHSRCYSELALFCSLPLAQTFLSHLPPKRILHPI